jgi:hypothetical protein
MSRSTPLNMRRQIFNMVTLLSLLLALTFLALWVRSYWRLDSIVYSWPANDVAVGSLDGMATYTFSKGVGYPGVPRELGWKHLADGGQVLSIVRKQWQNQGNIAGFNVMLTRGYWEPSDEFGWYGESEFWSVFQPSKRPTGPLMPQNISGAVFENSTQVIIPHWMHVLPASMLPAWWMRSALRRRRLERIGKCTQCGYDLRASSDRCPECGTVSAERIAI